MIEKRIDITSGQRPGGQTPPRAGSRAGFTLTELLVVLAIIGIILAFITRASVDGVRRANEQATLGLIQKLESAMSERMDALMSVSVYPNAAHQVLANIYNNTANPILPSTDRAQVIALYDFIKAEVPDVFFPSGDSNYPLNFAAQPYPGTLDSTAPYSLTYGQYILPLGAGIANDASTTFGAYQFATRNGTGIFGASYAAAAGIYKNLGYNPKGYDGVDNDQNGLVDDWAEGVDGTNSATVTARLANHTHKTARSEMLYAVLVEGVGPLGASFSPDDFTSREVADTDNDGLPEFIDAWGEPLQFFRWPIYYHSDTQRGYMLSGDLPVAPYASAFDDREQNPLDLNQTLANPSWVLAGTNISDTNFKNFFNSGGPTGFSAPGDSRLSLGARMFQNFFHTLAEPLVVMGVKTGAEKVGTVPIVELWDRSNSGGNFPDYALRRAYFAKFLIISGGPDKVPGVGLLNFNYTETGYVNDGSGAPVAVNASNVIQIENTAAQIAPNQWNASKVAPALSASTAANQTTLYLQQNAGTDDISNQVSQGAAGSNP